jgi:hypothetical protein
MGARAGLTITCHPEPNSGPSELFLLRAMERQWLAVTLLAIGILAGTVGNFLTLKSYEEHTPELGDCGNGE